MSIFLHYLNLTKYYLEIHHNSNVRTFNFTLYVGAMEITQIVILILLFKRQLDHVHLLYLCHLQYHQTLYTTSEIIYHREPIKKVNSSGNS